MPLPAGRTEASAEDRDGNIGHSSSNVSVNWLYLQTAATLVRDGANRVRFCAIERMSLEYVDCVRFGSCGAYGPLPSIVTVPAMLSMAVTSVCASVVASAAFSAMVTSDPTAVSP